MAMYISHPLFRDAKLCGVQACVFDKLGCVVGESRSRNTALGRQKPTSHRKVPIWNLI
jgi:hypothetical protein